MNTLRFAWVNYARDWKSGEQAVMTLAVIVAVSALTAIAFFTNRIALGVEQQAGEVLAADLRIEAATPFNDEYLSEATKLNLSIARLVTFPSVVLNGDHSSLAALRAASSAYPLRGQLKVAMTSDGAAQATTDFPQRGEVWIDPRLLAQLAADIGDDLEIGRSKLKVTRILTARPDQGSQFVDMAPSALFHVDDLPATDLIQPGSRASYTLLFAGEPKAIAAFKSYVREHRRAGDRVVDIEEASPQIRAAIDRAGRFLGLASLVSVILSAIAVAMAARRYTAQRLDGVALMKSMGASQNRILVVHMLQLGMLAVVASIVGTAIGYLAQQGLAWLLRDLVREALPQPSAMPALLGFATAISILIGFALPPLLQLKRVPPIRVLRRDVAPPPLHFLIINGFAIGAVIALIAWVAQDTRLVTQVMIGMGATFFILYGAGWLLVKVLTRFRGAVGVSWRYGVANIARRGRESVVQVVAFGLGLMVLLVLVVVRNDLLNNWRASLPDDAPNQFLINIQPLQAQQIKDFFIAHQLPEPNLVPMARARLTKINGLTVREWRASKRVLTAEEKGKGEGANPDKAANDRSRNFMEREANLTWAEHLPADNKLVEGKWWDGDAHHDPLISVEVGIARSWHLSIGDRVTFDVAGEPITATITNFREVQWDTFKPNFFIVFSPGVIDHAAGTYITSVHVPAARRAVMREFSRSFPQVTAIDIDAVIAQVRSVMDKVSLAVQYVFLFTLLAGIAVLFAAIQSTRDERRYESAMLRTLGASRRTVLQGIASEFAVLGLLAGILAAAGASFAGWLLATRLLNLDYAFDKTVWVAGLTAGVALVGMAGTLVTYSVVNTPPVETLRRSY